MGSARQKLEDTAENVGRDLGTGIESIGQGNIGQGIDDIGAAHINAFTIGQAEKMGIKGRSALTREANAAAEGAAADARSMSDMKGADRLTRIANRLNEAVRLRQKQPGKAQTLLTSQTPPSAENPNTLLTTAARR